MWLIDWNYVDLFMSNGGVTKGTVKFDITPYGGISNDNWWKNDTSQILKHRIKPTEVQASPINAYVRNLILNEGFSILFGTINR